MELEKFFEIVSHDHPLILKEQHNHHQNSVPLSCVVCGKKITSDPLYCCEEENCEENIFIHKTCTKLPLQIQHHLHPDHPLFLTSPSTYNNLPYFCDACKRIWKKYVYHCSTCDFGLDVKCASTRENLMEHPCHKHPLKTTNRIFLGHCDACGTKHEGVFYSCTTCEQFWIHEDCASLPLTYEDTNYHDHPLTLAYSLPVQYTTFGVLCQICEQQARSRLWIYHCDVCRFVFHVNCVTPQTEHFLSVLLPKKEFYSSRREGVITNHLEDSGNGVVHLPLPDGFSSLADHFSEDIQLRATAKTICFAADCHDQPLIQTFDDVQESDTRLDILHDHVKYQKKLCNGCIMPVTTDPSYKCVDDECNFILHESCAELPLEIQHPCHSEHMLVLDMTPDFSYFVCQGCQYPCSGFKYSCEECEYHLDLICASLPTTIRYETHANHTMTLKNNISRYCIACHFTHQSSTFAYSCGSCDFQLHAICATYPTQIRHRNDDTHSYSLTYRHVEGHDSDYLCDICEYQIDPELWFYHCVECDKSLHAICHPTYDWISRIKFGGFLTMEIHEHSLNLVPVIPINTQCNGYVRVITRDQTTCCDKCGKTFDLSDAYSPMGLKCLDCKYNLHYQCFCELTIEASCDRGDEVIDTVKESVLNCLYKTNLHHTVQDLNSIIQTQLAS